MTTTPKKHGGRRPGGGRPRTAPDGTRKTRHVRWSDAEWRRVLELARAAGMTASAWIRQRSLDVA